MTRLSHRVLAASALLLAATLSSEAAACPMPYDDCTLTDHWYRFAPVNAAAIPADGALILDGSHNGFDDAPWLDKIEITVTRDGEPVAGALATTSHPGVLQWRPTMAWTPGATYQLTGKLTNPYLENSNCGPETIDLAVDLVISKEPAAALGVPMFTGMMHTNESELVSLDTLACCVDVAPEESFVGCGGSSVIYDPSTCAATEVNRYMLIDLTGAPAAPGPAGAQIGYTLKVDGQVQRRSLAPGFSLSSGVPVCTVVEAENLTTGEVKASAEQCFGQDIAATLGTQPVDPSTKLECALQQCETVDNAWHIGRCTPYESAATTDTDTDTDTDTGGQNASSKGCNVAPGTGDDTGLLTLGLLTLLGLGKQRRRGTR